MKRYILLLISLLFFNSVFSQNEKINELISDTDEMNLNIWDFVDYAKNKITDKTELAKFFYHWVGTHIEYDDEVYQNILNNTIDHKQFQLSQDEYEVYDNRKAVCAGYANLYKWFMDEINVEAVVISGHIRDERNHYVDLSDDSFAHAWNAIKLNDKWVLVDATWGTSDDISMSEYYFDLKPELAIITHYPSEQKWQLLEKPLSLKEFNESKFIKPIWFFSGFSDIPVLKADENYYYLIYKSNPDKNFSVELMYSSDNINFSPIQNQIEIEQDDHMFLRFPKTGIPQKAYFKLNMIFTKMYGNTQNTFIQGGIFYFKT